MDFRYHSKMIIHQKWYWNLYVYWKTLFIIYWSVSPPNFHCKKWYLLVRRTFMLGQRLYEAQKEMRLSSDRFAICMRPVISYVLRKDHMHPAGKLILVQILKTPYSNWYVNYGGNIPKINLNSWKLPHSTSFYETLVSFEDVWPVPSQYYQDELYEFIWGCTYCTTG